MPAILDNQLEVRPGPIAEHVITVDLDVRVTAQLRLRDSFQWDLTNPDNSPEEFAAALVADFLLQEKLKSATGTEV